MMFITTVEIEIIFNVWFRAAYKIYDSDFLSMNRFRYSSINTVIFNKVTEVLVESQQPLVAYFELKHNSQMHE